MNRVIYGGMPGILQEDIDKLKQYILEESPQADVFFYGKDVLPADQLIKIAKDADILISWDQPMDESTYSALSLKAYCAASVGYNAANLSVANQHGVKVVHVPDYCTEEVAGHTVALMLYLYRRLYRMADYIKSGQWNSLPMDGTKRFDNQMVGLLGFGRIGQAVARKLSGFGVKFVATDPAYNSEEMAALGVTKVSFEELLSAADYLSLHTPLQADTAGILNQAAFQRMKPGAYLINTARGGLIDESALLSALDGTIEAAALDVLAEEPPAGLSVELVEHPRVIVTGHTAYYSQESSDRQLRLTAQNVAQLLKGQLPKHTLNP